MSLSYKSVLPDTGSDLNKKVQVQDMFNDIAPQYDMLNHLLSLGIDKIWRNKAIAEIKNVKHDIILDVATGTADLAIAASKLNPTKIIGVDIATQMLVIGRNKISGKNLNNIELLKGDSENLEFPSNTFDVVMSAYGVRNFENLKKGLSEMFRTLKAGGTVVILEFSQPVFFPFKQLYHFYFRRVLPMIGFFFSKHRTAYTYLPLSVIEFPQGKNFCKLLLDCGFKDPKAKTLTFGVTTLYTAIK